MKICFIMDSAFSLGGVQRVVSVIANKLVENHNIDILCISDEYPINRKLYNLDERINVIINKDIMKKDLYLRILLKPLRVLNDNLGIFNNKKSIKILENIYFPNQIRKKFIEFINNNNYDIVIGVEGIFSVLLGIISKKIKSKTVGWQHNSYNAYFRTKKKYYWNQDWIFINNLYKLNDYIVLTNSDKEIVEEKFNVYATRIYNPLSFESKEKSKCNNKNILFVGRLVEYQKGIDLLLRAFSFVIKNDNKCKLTILGDGEDKDNIKQMIKDLGLKQNVKLEPSTNNVQKYYLNSSIFVSTSRWEGFGLVLTEAMECGLPVISFENTGPNEIINNNGVNGILVPKNDIKKLAKEIINLINDNEKMSYLASNSIKRAYDFNILKIVTEWENKILK